MGIEARLGLGQIRDEAGWEAFARGWRELGATHLDLNTMGSQDFTVIGVTGIFRLKARTCFYFSDQIVRVEGCFDGNPCELSCQRETYDSGTTLGGDFHFVLCCERRLDDSVR